MEPWLLPKQNRYNADDVVAHGEHRDSGGEGGRKKELEQASWITLTWAMNTLFSTQRNAVFTIAAFAP
jgi:hypothetical protein